MALKLKQQVSDLKQLIQTKDQSLTELRSSMKASKFIELESECKAYRNECGRLRMVAENTIIATRGSVVHQNEKKEHIISEQK